ncbi:potassium-transporting ATPase subunit KdpC [Devosia pacifica]|uniref:potassium-transporting ATPase subunit KdpC n=1 Tax=Devosia pacifica TaxID=1335967 RepID=UPI001673E736|nr:potassium-transporting ATPase subunit KdpC [Devosia pacifica]
MIAQIRPALVLLILFSLVTGLIYPLAITGVAQAAFPVQANGSLVSRDGAIVGSELIGQSFVGDGYFHPRPSAVGYDAAGSGGTNLGATSATLAEVIAARVSALSDGEAVPADAATASGSGLDPHISPAFAQVQVGRVAQARGLEAGQLAGLVARHAQQPLFGIFGEPRVNVLELNLALDDLEADSN